MKSIRKHTLLVGGALLVVLIVVLALGGIAIGDEQNFVVKVRNPTELLKTSDNTGYMTAVCPTGMVPVNCGYTLKTGKTIRLLHVDPQYIEAGDAFNGCMLEWDVSGSKANVQNQVTAYCKAP